MYAHRYVYLCMYAHVYVYICMYAHVHVCVCVCVCARTALQPWYKLAEDLFGRIAIVESTEERLHVFLLGRPVLRV